MWMRILTKGRMAKYVNLIYLLEYQSIMKIALLTSSFTHMEIENEIRIGTIQYK